MDGFTDILGKGLRAVTVGSLAATIMLAPLSASALDAEFSNTETGADSDNRNSVDGARSITFTIVNNGSVDNDFDLDLNTGGNTVRNNTTVGDVSTGDIQFEIVAENTVNEGVTTIDLGDGFGDVSVMSSNSTTGSGSTNDNAVSVAESHSVSTTNTGSVNNTFALTLNTGNNVVSGNTTVGNISTGDISGSINVTNRVNAPEPEQEPSPMPEPVPSDGGQGGQAEIVNPSKIVQATATTPAAITQLTAKRDAFFPAGAALSVLPLLILATFAGLIVYGSELLRQLTPRLIPMYRYATVLPAF